MPRNPREKSETGVYHIIVRGINQQDIFHYEDDYYKYLGGVQRIGLESGITVLGYCLMTNHVHLLINENNMDVSVYMKRIGVSYANWYNWKYERSGHVFQDRFKSECVENDAYLLTVIRYIHMNPVKAGIVNNPEEYPWSSCATYYKNEKQAVCGVDTTFIMNIFSDDVKMAKERFYDYMNESKEDNCLDLDIKRHLGEKEAHQLIVKLLKGRPVSVLHTMEPENRKKVIRELRYMHGLGLRQLSRVTGLSMHTIRNV